MAEKNKLVKTTNVVVNNVNNNDMKQEATYKTVKANINGTVENIILGYSIYNMKRPKDKADLISLIDKEKMLDVIFHLGNADIFWNEGIELKDAHGNIIPKDTPMFMFHAILPILIGDLKWMKSYRMWKYTNLNPYKSTDKP